MTAKRYLIWRTLCSEKFSGIDKGYISEELFGELSENGIRLITKIKKNMKNKLLTVIDKILLRRRSLTETVNDQLRNISRIEHTRHRSIRNFMVNIVAGLIAYTWQPKKPSLNLSIGQTDLLPVVF
ncbi:MAG: transposase [Desulfobacteraceae bacterium]|nr:transposase [Desulfobacteraceae bacterium]